MDEVRPRMVETESESRYRMKCTERFILSWTVIGPTDEIKIKRSIYYWINMSF